MRRSRSRQVAWIAAGLIVLVLLGSGAGLAPAFAAPQSSPTHKVIIRSAGEPANYSLAVSGNIVSGPREQADRATAHRVDGHVGGNDTVDAITYTGHITAFQTDSSTLKATLDGTLIDARMLAANHLQFETRSTGNTSHQPVRYTVTVSTTIISGEATEDRDSPTNTTTVSGWLLPGDSDGFYYQGEIVDASTSHPARIHVNGQSRSVATLRQSAHSQKIHNQSTATLQPTSTSKSNVHTLVIDHQNGSVGYTATISGKITLAHTESGDSIAGPTVTGRVGGLPWKQNASDRKDVIHFTGHLRNFEYDGEGGTIRLTLDGKRVSPNSLVATPQSTPTPTPTRTASPSTTMSPTTTQQPTTTITTHAPTTDGDTPTNAAESGLFDQLVPVITGIAALGAVLYLIFGDG